MEQITSAARARLDKETEALKNVIYGLIKTGQPAAAGMILDQYAQVNPGDPEIRPMKDMISLAEAEESGENSGSAVKLKDKMKVLSEIETIFIMNNISVTRSGVTNSVLRKVKLMEDKWGYKPLVLLCEHNIELRRTLSALRRSALWLNTGTRILNVYDYFQKAYRENLNPAANYLKAGNGARYIEISRGIYEIYDGEKLLRKEYFTGLAGGIRLVEHFEDGNIKNGVYYDDWGYINYIREYEPGNEKRFICENYYTTDGNICIKALYGESELEKLVVYDDDGSVVRECADNAELAALCLERILTDDKFYLIVVENGLLAKAAAAAENKKSAKAAVVHNVFLEDPYDLESDPQWHYKYLCENSAKFDSIVLLTHAARNDFYRKYGGIRNTFVIPHPYPYGVIKADFDKRDHRKAVIVARLDPYKQLGYAIDIFGLAVKKLPGVKLEIYGAGPEENKCRERIKALGLENSVSLMGFTGDPAAVFSGAALSMMTSSAEGYPLALIESVCNGCPVFAFDIKYGPSEIITDGVGFLIPRFDKEAYAEKLTAFFNDGELQRTMSENAYAAASRFGANVFLESWYKFTETTYRRIKK